MKFFSLDRGLFLWGLRCLGDSDVESELFCSLFEQVGGFCCVPVFEFVVHVVSTFSFAFILIFLVDFKFEGMV